MNWKKFFRPSVPFDFTRPEPIRDGTYKIFTNQFDEVVEAKDLSKSLGPTGRKLWLEECRIYAEHSKSWKAKASLEWIDAIGNLNTDQDPIMAKAAVSILVDHSGSMQGQRAFIACALVEVLADALSRLNVEYEILGFTTTSWKGGKSRKLWMSMGRPKNPGRLCDLLHIVYRSFDTTSPGVPRAIKNMFREDLMKENVDGEALDWAAHRLKQAKAENRVMLVVSDGAPVDDSTLSENPKGILHQHVQSVSKRLQENGIKIGGIGIDHDVTAYYGPGMIVNSPKDTGSNLAKFVFKLLEVS